MISDFRKHLKADGVPLDEEAFTKDLAFITSMMRYEIDLNLWSVEDARRHLITTDPQAQLALSMFAEAERMARAPRGTSTPGTR